MPNAKRRSAPVPPTTPVSPPPSTALIPIEERAPPAPIDLHGFDPAAFDWVPRPRKPRKDGWSAEKQRLFIETLADTGLVIAAAREVDMSLASCYRLRREPDGHGFAAAWEAAVQQASHRLTDIAFDRAINGTEDPLFDDQGRRIGCRYRYNDRLLMFLLRAHQPARYRHAHESARAAAEPAAPAVLPVPIALERLLPAQPDAPHLLLDETRLAEEIDVYQQLVAIELESPLHEAPTPFREAWQKQSPPLSDADKRSREFDRRLEWAKFDKSAPDDDSWPTGSLGSSSDDGHDDD